MVLVPNIKIVRVQKRREAFLQLEVGGVKAQGVVRISVDQSYRGNAIITLEVVNGFYELSSREGRPVGSESAVEQERFDIARPERTGGYPPSSRND